MKHLVALGLALLLAACGPHKFNSVDITGANYARTLAMSDHAGVQRSLADYKGKVVVVFFGFAQCPDVCPTTLTDMAEIKRRLGKDGDKLQVKVSLRNRGAGHMVPSGSPLRKLTVSVDVYPQAGPRLTEERSYQRSIADEKGNLLADEPSVWMRGARVVSDNRLRPHEERTETFVFDVPRADRARVQARFSYHYSPLESQDTGKLLFLVLPAIAESGPPATTARRNR